ncbi:fimbrial assembly protein [Nitrosospira sp. Is2]|uniref:fimbrial assembly protein n=1 Tax=Nitrosospira sp. Is2 TaxID=3080532 RepID=UPI0029532D88|nr:fimbrial assembly protein [Nitrosospira sp. Is2]WON75068.1 fimbrial assembly protein [Nitrosospira sp. Is2]
MRRLGLRFPDTGGGAERVGYIIMSLGLMMLGAVLYEFNLAMNEVAYWDTRIASVERRVQRTTAPQGTSSSSSSSSSYVGRDMKQEVKKANAVMSELDLPWQALFDSVEYAANHDVALLSFQPDPAGRMMRIGAEAKNIAAMLDFVGALEREPVLKDAHLLKYEIKRDDPHRPVIFLLTAIWA